MTINGDGRMWRALVERYNDPPGWRSGPMSGRTNGDAKKQTPQEYARNTESRVVNWLNAIPSYALDGWIRWAWATSNLALAIRLERERERRWQWVLRQCDHRGGDQ